MIYWIIENPLGFLKIGLSAFTEKLSTVTVLYVDNDSIRTIYLRTCPADATWRAYWTCNSSFGDIKSLNLI
jgi:hypothetical protein